MLDLKLEILKNILKNMQSVLIAYSGGVDSTFLLKVAKETIGNRVLAVTAKSETYPNREYRQAKNIAKKLKVKHLTIHTEELFTPLFSSNPHNRCYYCKKELFTRLKQIAIDRNIKCIVVGTNYDDLDDFRPGMKACEESGVRSPLKEAGLTKEEIRSLSFKMKLPTWDKPAAACLASRFPYGIAISKKKLHRVQKAEDYLYKLGFRQIRVRHHDSTARIEVHPKDIQRLASLSLRNKIVDKFKNIGYCYITLDLQGYRTGSLNEVLSKKQIRRYQKYGN